MKSSEDLIRDRLFAFKDDRYKEFQGRLMPGIQVDRIRYNNKTPLLRKYYP